MRAYHGSRRCAVWAQIIKVRIQPDREQELKQVQEEISQRVRDSRPGWRRTITLQNQNDPAEYYNVVFFESEESARAQEQSAEQQENVRRIQSVMDGPPEFVDCNVVWETAR